MANISFPGSSSHLHSPTASTQESFFGSSYNPSSSFQLNPLSPQPPRTPRSSIISSSNIAYVSEMYSSTVSTQEKVEERPPTEEFEEGEVADDVRETVSEAVVKKVKVPEVWREVLKTSSGRDKAFVGSL